MSDDNGIAVIIGATGGIGRALVAALTAQGRYARVVGFGRSTTPALDLTDEATIVVAAASLATSDGDIRLIIDATGILSGDGVEAEKTWRTLDPARMARAFAVNAIGPALLMKHFLPLLPREKRAVFATLSARVGSIGDNRLGGWYSYRASKAALNQLVRTAAIELQRRAPHAICVALHPGTVDTGLSRPFARTGLAVRSPAEAAQHILVMIDALTPVDSGGFFDWQGQALPP